MMSARKVAISVFLSVSLLLSLAPDLSEAQCCLEFGGALPLLAAGAAVKLLKNPHHVTNLIGHLAHIHLQHHGHPKGHGHGHHDYGHHDHGHHDHGQYDHGHHDQGHHDYSHQDHHGYSDDQPDNYRPSHEVEHDEEDYRNSGKKNSKRQNVYGKYPKL